MGESLVNNIPIHCYFVTNIFYEVRKVKNLSKFFSIVCVMIFGLFNFNAVIASGRENLCGGYVLVHLTRYDQIDDIANALRIVNRLKKYKFLSSDEHEELNWIIHRDEEIITKGKHKGEKNPYFGPDDSTEKVKKRLEEILKSKDLTLKKLEEMHNCLIKNKA